MSRRSKKRKWKKIREEYNKSNLSNAQENPKKTDQQYVSEIVSESSAETNKTNADNSTEGSWENINADKIKNTSQVNDTPKDESISQECGDNTNESKSETSDTNTNESTTENCNDNVNESNEYYEEIKARQAELLNNIRNMSEAINAMTLTRDNISSLRVERVVEFYFTREVRPLLDALNIISFAVSNMTSAAQNIQVNTFGDRQEIRHALRLSYRMNDEVEDIIDALDRRLKIFINEIDKMDRNCPPFE